MSRTIRISREAPLAEYEAAGFVFEQDGDKRLGFVVRYQGQLRAYVNECRHIPIPLDFGDLDFFTTDRKYLFCRNHGAVYEPASGDCLGGPCGGEGLRSLEVQEKGDEIIVKIPTGLEPR